MRMPPAYSVGGHGINERNVGVGRSRDEYLLKMQRYEEEESEDDEEF